MRRRGSFKRASTDDDEHSSRRNTRAQIAQPVRIVGWLVIIAVVIAIVRWLQGVDENLRRELIEECLVAARQDCRFEQRSRIRHAGTLAGYFPDDDIKGYSRWTPVLKQTGVFIVGMVIGRSLFGQPSRRS